ncbi:MAG: hypothetical protein DRI74_08410 [Bacteroidetes bacterium]|nr:MAG: hypothetical protein DRI74_08410 [Bacteroidota bacterium]
MQMIAGLPGLFRFLLLLIVFYYVFKLLVRFVFPFFVKRFLNKAQQNFYNQNPHLDPDQQKKKEGEVKVESKPKGEKNTEQNKSKNSDDDFGDYVDFEEIKE